MSRILSRAALALCGIFGMAGMSAGEESPQVSQGTQFQWQDDYSQATRQAVAAQKMLFIFFHDAQPNRVREAFERRSLTQEVLQPFTDRYVWAKVPTDAAITVDGRSIKILSHAAFREMQGRHIIGYEGGEEVKVPYFDLLGDLEDVEDGDALTLSTLTGSKETATIVRSGKAFSLTQWAQMASRDGRLTVKGMRAGKPFTTVLRVDGR